MKKTSTQQQHLVASEDMLFDKMFFGERSGQMNHSSKFSIRALVRICLPFFLLIFFSAVAVAQPYIRTTGGVGQYGYIEKDATATNFLVANGGHTNIYQYGVRSYNTNGAGSNSYAYTASGSCARGDDATGNYGFGTIAAGNSIYSSVFVEYCGPVYSCGSMTPTGACFNERQYKVLDINVDNPGLASTITQNTNNVVLSFKIDPGGVTGRVLNRLWIVNDGTATETTDISNTGFKLFYENVTGSESFSGSESNVQLYGDYSGNATNNNVYGHDALGAIAIPSGGLRCYIVLNAMNTSAYCKTVQMSIITDGISLDDNANADNKRLLHMDKSPASGTSINVVCPTITTNTSISGSPFCAGAAVSVPFTITGTFVTGNVFTAELSNASGSFASPVSIGTITQTTAGTISATIPGGTATGTGYRIRVTATGGITGSDNGTNLSVNATAAWIGGSSGNWETAANWCGGVPTSSTNVTVPSGVTITIGADAVANTLTVTGTLIFGGAYDLSITAGGSVTNNGTFTAGTGKVIFLGNGTVTGSNAITFNNVTVNGTATLSTIPTINGTLQINAGGAVGSAPIYGSSSTLNYNSGGNYNVASEWTGNSATPGSGIPKNVLISGTGTNLLLPNTSRGIGGNITVSAGTLTLSTTAGADLYVGGNYTVGAAATVINNGRATYFNGASGTQLVTKTGGGTVYFDYLIVNKASGDLKLDNTTGSLTNIQINSSTNNTALSVLQLLNGSIDLNDQRIILNGTVGNSTNIYVAGSGQRKIYTSTGTGNVEITGTSVPGVANLNVSRASGAASLTFDANVTLSTSVGVNFGPSGMTLVNSIFQIDTNGFCITNSPDYGNSSSLIYNNGSGGFKRNVEWNTNTPGAGYPNNIIVQNNTPLTLNVTYAAPSALGCSGYIDIKSGSSMDMGTMPYSLNTTTDIFISGTLLLSSVSGGDLNVGRSWTRTGTFTQNNRNVTFNGSGKGILTATGGQDFSYVYLNKTAQTDTLTLASDVRVSDEIGFTKGTLSFGSNGKYLVLLSTATKTARVAQSSSANTAFKYGTGNGGKFIVQRYVPAKRAWRLMSPPISGSTATISQAWQEGQAFDYASTGFQASDTVSSGFATHITGGTVANGFDLSYQNNASIKYYGGSAWLNPANTNSTLVKSQEGWMLFVRGDRKNFGQITTIYKAPVITTLRPRGEIFIGQKRFPPSGTLTGKQLIGNPFASAFDFHSAYEATKAANGGTLPYADQYYMWDPNLGGTRGVGAFVTYSWNSGSGNYDRTSLYAPISLDDRYIPSGAAFFVDFGATGGYLLIDETDKNTATTTKAYRPSAGVRTNLLSVESDGSTFLSDGVLNLFSDTYNNAIDQDDATKLINIEGENFSTKKGNVLLSIEKRKLPQFTDTIFYNWSKVKIRAYQLEITADSLRDSWLKMYLEDNYKKTSTPVSSFGDTTRYDFEIVREDSGTFKADRFRLIMQYDPPVFTDINAYQQYDDVAVQWQIANEKYIAGYVIERSLNGVDFVKVGTVKDLAASGASISQWVDTKPVIGNNFYRVYGVGAAGQTFTSNIVKVTLAQPALSVYPNPVTNGLIGIQLTNMRKGSYEVSILNAQGQKVATRTIKHAGGNGTEKIPLTTVKTRGVYQVEISKPDRTKESVKVLY